MGPLSSFLPYSLDRSVLGQPTVPLSSRAGIGPTLVMSCYVWAGPSGLELYGHLYPSLKKPTFGLKSEYRSSFFFLNGGSFLARFNIIAPASDTLRQKNCMIFAPAIIRPRDNYNRTDCMASVESVVLILII